MKKAWLGLVTVGLLGSSAFAGTADFVFVVDESGSMGGDHAWLAGMISTLDSALATAGFTGRYGLVGYGGSSPHLTGHTHLVGGGQFGTAAQFSTAIGTLVLSGGTEDGWDGIDEAMGYTFGSGAAINVVLVTDEDRDVAVAHTYAAVLASLTGRSALLNAVVNASYAGGTYTGPGGAGSGTRIGVDSSGNVYFTDGLGGYTSGVGGTFSSGFGTTKTDYIDMAWATGGAAWDLNVLRAGGFFGTSFTKAFVDIKVQEVITSSGVPLPPAAWAGLSLLGVLGAMRTRRRKTTDLS